MALTKLVFIILLGLAQLPIVATANTPWSLYEQQVGTVPTTKNKLTLLQNGEFGDALKQIITNAQEFILIQQLSIDCDEATEPYIQLLEQKAKLGTTIYLNINRIYSWLAMSCLKRLELSGVKVQRSNSHASYWANDQRELLIGSVNLARMFLLSNGRNFLDRDVSVLASGALATEAIFDFTKTWEEELFRVKKIAWDQRKAGRIRQEYKTAEDSCYFLAEDKDLGLTSWSDTLAYWIPQAQKTIFLSGVKLEIGSHNKTQSILMLLQKAAAEKREVTFLGNGPRSGNGELTMVLKEWIEHFKDHHFPISRWITRLRDFDSEKVWERVSSNYQKWLSHPRMKIFMYDQFLHYKIWSFDDRSVLIGSANLADDSFEKFHEAAIFCRDKNLVHQWKKAQQIDFQFAEPFK